MTSVAVVGTGSAGLRHLANLLRLGVGEVIAVSEHGRRQDLAVDGVPIPLLHDYGEALDRVDAVVIANPTSLHHSYLEAAVRAGRSVLCEKPVSTSAAGVAELARAADEAGVVVGVGCQFRFNRMLGRLRDRVLGGELGTILDVDAVLGEHLADYHPDEDYRRSYAARQDRGGGVLLTQIHQVDFLGWIFGPFVTAFAVGGRRTDLDIDVEDSVSYMLESAAGVGIRAHMDYAQRPKRLDLVVTGTGGRIGWDYHRNELTLEAAAAGASPEVHREPFDRNDMFCELMADFLDSVRTGRPPRTTLDDAAAALAVVDAIKGSLRVGGSVAVAGSADTRQALSGAGRRG
jgi:predicted dehydrogenase